MVHNVKQGHQFVMLAAKLVELLLQSFELHYCSETRHVFTYKNVKKERVMMSYSYYGRTINVSIGQQPQQCDNYYFKIILETDRICYISFF